MSRRAARVTKTAAYALEKVASGRGASGSPGRKRQGKGGDVDPRQLARINGQLGELLGRCDRVQASTAGPYVDAPVEDTEWSAARGMDTKVIHSVDDLVRGMRSEYYKERLDLDCDIQQVDRGIPTHRARFDSGLKWLHLQAYPDYVTAIEQGGIAPALSAREAMELNYIYAAQEVLRSHGR